LKSWGYHERFGKRIPAWQFLEIDEEQWIKDFSHTKKELICIYAMVKYISTSPLDFLTHTSQKFINMWRPVWRNSRIKTYLMMGFPYIVSIIFFFIHFFRKKNTTFK
jgi:nucleoside diphosphate kinase